MVRSKASIEVDTMIATWFPFSLLSGLVVLERIACTEPVLPLTSFIVLEIAFLNVSFGN